MIQLLDDTVLAVENESSPILVFAEYLMAPQPERIASLETHRFWHWMALGGVGAWCVWLSVTVIGMGGDVRAIKQSIADEGSQIVRNIENPKSTEQLAANLSLATARLQIARSEDKSPNSTKLKPLRKALEKQSMDHPDLPETWKAVATLASYQTYKPLEKSGSLPDCDVIKKPDLIRPEEMPEMHTTSGVVGYLFRGCRLHLDDLPKGKLIRTFVTKPALNMPSGSPIAIGYAAFVINCEIVLSDSGIAESDILFLDTANCNLQFQVSQVPPPSSQRLLIASLEAPVPGSMRFDFRKSN
jgi:hypothetical protein